MLTVQFHASEEFLDEIRKDRDKVERSIVRLTILRAVRGHFVSLSLLATAMVSGNLVRLRQTVGECFNGPGQEFNQLLGQAAEQLRQLDYYVRGMDLEVRPGFFEDCHA